MPKPILSVWEKWRKQKETQSEQMRTGAPQGTRTPVFAVRERRRGVKPFRRQSVCDRFFRAIKDFAPRPERAISKINRPRPGAFGDLLTKH
jgi:hypothetical protein